MKKILYIVLVGIVFTLVACAKNTSAAYSDANMGKKMSLIFDANPTTGFLWTYETKEGDEYGQVNLVSNEYVQNETNKEMAGAGGKINYIFEGAKAGKQEIKLIYKRPWEGGETAYDVIYEIEIDDNLNIRCLNKKKGTVETNKELSTFPDPIFSN